MYGDMYGEEGWNWKEEEFVINQRHENERFWCFEFYYDLITNLFIIKHFIFFFWKWREGCVVNYDYSSMNW